MLTRQFLLFGPLVLALSAACSSEGEGPGANKSTIQTRAAFCTEWGVRACGPEVVEFCQASSVEDCRASQTAFCLTLVPDSYAAGNARQCLDAVGAAYADGDLDSEELLTVRQLGEPCNLLAHGAGGVNDQCVKDEDCDGPRGLECVLKGGTGTCQVPEFVDGGFDCSAPQQVCEDGFYCNTENCVAYRRLGATCSADSECGPEAYCDIVPPDTQNVCIGRGGTGDACLTGRECVSQICLELANGNSSCLNRVRLSPAEPICEDLR
jgi:hypothetical protein